MFGSVLDRLQGLISRSFVIASFFPLLIFAGVNAAIFAAAFPDAAKQALQEWQAHTERDTALTLVGVAVAAYLLAPLVPVFRLILEAEFLPPLLRNLMRHRYIREGERDRRKTREATSGYAWAKKCQADRVSSLQGARLKGGQSNSANQPHLIWRAYLSVRLLGFVRGRLGVNRWLLERASRWVDHALGNNSADLPVSNPNRGRSERLNDAHSRLLDELSIAVAETENRVLRCVARQRRTMVFDDPRPTRLGNLRAVAEKYVLSAYGVDFEFLWPRMQLVLVRDDKFAPRIEAAKAQLDFALLLFMLISLIPAIWLPLLAWKATDPWLFLGIGLSAPLLFAMFHRIVWESQRDFGEVLKAAVDGTRLEVLKLLRQAPPPRLAKERETWAQLQRALEEGADVLLRRDAT